jgi:hypothetical protein
MIALTNRHMMLAGKPLKQKRNDMVVTTEVVYNIWNDVGYGYEVGPDADTGSGIEVRYYEESFGTPIRQLMIFTKEDAMAIVKDALADRLAIIFGLTESEADSLTKANKTALIKLIKFAD